MRILPCLTLAAALLLAGPAHAQLRVGLGAGASVPTDRFDEYADVGFHVTGHVTTLVPRSPLGFRGELSVTRFDAGGGDVRIVSGTANLLLTPTGFAPTKPYLIVGLGAYNVESPEVDLGRGVRLASTSSNGLGLNAGFGLDFSLGARRTFLEARWVSVDPGEGGRITFVPVSFGLTF